MNGKESGPTGFERAELDRLLPDPARRRLPADRHQILRERFMHQIRESAAAPPRRTRRALLAPALLGAGLAVALGAGAVTTVVSGPDQRPPVGQGDSSVGPRDEVTTLLDRITLAAQTRSQTAKPVRDDQYSYIEIIAKTPSGSSRERVWKSVDGTRTGLVRNDGAVDTPFPKITDPSLSQPTYRFLAGLPTDPDALVTMINEEIRREEAPGKGRPGDRDRPPGLELPPGSTRFWVIERILRDCTVPPAVQAALYKAVAKVAGVSVVEDVVDATGRHGVGLSATYSNLRTTWIFDRDTLRLLGFREEITKDSMEFTKADWVSVSAFAACGIVDKVGETPK